MRWTSSPTDRRLLICPLFLSRTSTATYRRPMFPYDKFSCIAQPALLIPYVSDPGRHDYLTAPKYFTIIDSTSQPTKDAKTTTFYICPPGEPIQFSSVLVATLALVGVRRGIICGELTILREWRLVVHPHRATKRTNNQTNGGISLFLP